MLLSVVRSIPGYLRGNLQSAASLQRRQTERFRKLVRHAADNSPYYRRIIESRGIDTRTCVPEDFPVLTKPEFIRNFDDIVTSPALNRERIGAFLARSREPDELFDDRYVIVHTSGTSGVVAYYACTVDEWERGHAHVIKVFLFGTAFLPGLRTKRIAHIAAMDGHYHSATLAHRALGAGNRMFEIRPFDINMPGPDLVEGLNEFQPHVVSGYGGGIKILVHHQETGELRIRPDWMFYGGDTLSPGEREHAARVLNTRIRSVYATSEFLMMGATDPSSGGLRLFEDDLIFEFAADHTVVTNLFNFTMPLIRYRLDDVLEPIGRIGKAHPYMITRDVIGRSEHNLEFATRDGRTDFIHPSVIAEFYVPGVHAFQLQQLDKSAFLFRVKLSPQLDASERQTAIRSVNERLSAILAQKEMTTVSFRVEETDALHVDPETGKFRLMVPPDQAAADALVAT